MTEDLRLYFEEKFKGFDYKLDQLIVQTTKTNGRVTALEGKVSNHELRCPQSARLEKIENKIDNVTSEQALWKVIKENPKVFITGIFAMAIMSFLSVIAVLQKIGVL
jgi:hypothetical protein